MTLKTNDGIEIAADYYPAEGNRHAILLHMMPADKTSWKAFAEKLQSIGISSIAIDERGHGKSQGGPGGYKEFTDEEQAAKIWDVRAAWAELKKRGAIMEKTAVIGGSIGANLAIRYLAENGQFPIAVALSPGVDYRSVTTDDAIVNLTPGQMALLVASDEDETSAITIKKLHELNKLQTELIEKQGIGHATDMFDNDPELLESVAKWVDQRL